MWLGPPSMNRKMTDFAFALKCGFFGANGSVPALWASSAAIAENAQRPEPAARRVAGSRGGTGRLGRGD